MAEIVTPASCRRQFNSDTALTFEVAAPAEGGSSLWFASFQPEARQSLDLALQAPVTPKATDVPFPGLELGPVIGKGSFGCVCRGALGYLIVAVKVPSALHSSRLSQLCMLCTGRLIF